MAGYFGVDPVLVRLLWLVALFSGIGFFAYLLFWLIVPKARAWPPPGYPSGDAAQGGLGLSNSMISGLLIVALAAVLGAQGEGLIDMLLPVTLIGFGVFLLNQRSLARGDASDAAHAGAAAGLEPSVESASTEAERASPAEDGPVTRIVLSVLALGVGIAWALSSTGVLTLSVATAAAIGLLIVGAGLVVSLWLGRARGLVPLGIVLGSVMLIASAVEGKQGVLDVIDDGGTGRGVGERIYTPSSRAELAENYAVDVGELTLDLSKLDLEGATERVHVGVGIGKALVIVPADVSVEVQAEVGVGSTQVFDVASEGLVRAVSKSEPGSSPGTLVLDLDVGVGEGTVRRD